MSRERVNPEWIAMLNARATGGRRARAREVGLRLDEYVAQSEAKIRDWVEGAPILIRTHEKGLLGFLRDRRWKVMAETRRSGGDLQTLERRLEAENQVLGIAEDAPPPERPISADLSGSDEAGAVNTYGAIVVEVSGSFRNESSFILGISSTHRHSAGAKSSRPHRRRPLRSML